MKRRSERPEFLDSPSISSNQVIDSLKFMIGVNRFLGGSAAVIDFFENANTPDVFSVVDLGSGSGDIAYALVQWARRKNKKIQVMCLDINPTCLDFARTHYGAPEIIHSNQSAFEFFKIGTFDYAMSSMFFHHLPEERIIYLLAMLNQHCRKGFIINDLWRSAWPAMGAALLGALSFKYVVAHDASVSVARAFRVEDFERYGIAAGLKDFSITRKPVYRITLSCHA